MKTIFNKITFLVLLVVFFGSCNDKDDSLSICKTEDLGITELRKYSAINYQTVNGNQVIDEANSYKWQWKTYNDTIEISGFGYTEGSEYHHFFKKVQGCIKYLSTREVIQNDVVSQTDPGIYWDDIIYTPYNLQAYTENQLIVTKIGYYKIWIELTPENNHPGPYYYEQYYHP